ncbi:PLP-dependent aminotransferase family protein [Cellulomonas endometrii]|uniref:aminotransferase-like domain-containing protein n=1 Tax=Cellulomonas endometrii TaxID=3036301 RepID=UPI0024ACE5BC|nr:PLP-dependent aminotransferase family protein [Cellulomonas endometrii]
MAPRTPVEAAQLARLISGWADDEGESLPALLGGAIEDLVVANALPDGTVLPPQRALASVLGVSRSTVTEAYERLQSAGVLETRQGSGSRVRRAGSASATRADAGRMTSFSDRDAGVVDLSSGALAGLPAVAREYGRLSEDDLARVVATDGYLPGGLPELRAVVARRTTASGLPTTPEQVLVTSGAQQAVWLVARLLVSPGDQILVEDPSYRGAIEAFAACGARLTTVPVRDDGIDVDHVERLLARGRYRAIYVQPVAHNPTGTSMPPARRRRLAELAVRHGAVVVEDRCAEDLLLDPALSPRPLVADVPGVGGIVIGTASKLLWGGLRVGWVRSAESTVRRLTRIRQGVDLAGAPVDQLVATRLLADADGWVDARRRQLTQSLQEVEPLLHRLRPAWRWRTPTGGVGLWVDTGTDAVALCARYRRRGVLLVPGPSFSATNGWERHIRIPLGHATATVADGLSRVDG